MIVNANLSASQLDSLLRVLRLHYKGVGYTIDDLKENLPFYMYELNLIRVLRGV